MGAIEDSIFDNYKRSLEEGNFDQAQKATELVKLLKKLVEEGSFRDYKTGPQDINPVIGSFFEPFPYRHYSDKGVVVRANSAITLTKSQNKLFSLFSENESSAENIKIISPIDISIHLWGRVEVNNIAVKIAVHRLRNRIELNPKKPQSILNVYGRGYVFIGKKA